MNDDEKEFKEMVEKIKVRDIESEDINLVRYSVLLFLRMYIDNPPITESLNEGEKILVQKFMEFLEIMHNQATVMDEKILEIIVEQALRASHIHEVILNNDDHKNDDNEKIIN